MAGTTKEAREAALVRLMDSYGDSVKRLCCVYLRELGAAEDAAQDTFVKAYQHIDELIGGTVRAEKAWLMRIAVNTCKDVLRSSWLRRIDRRRPIEELPLCAPAGHEESLAVMQAVSSLSPRLREIVLLHYYEDMSLKLCAQALGISAATATRRLQQAQERLRRLLSNYSDDAPPASRQTTERG